MTNRRRSRPRRFPVLERIQPALRKIDLAFARSLNSVELDLRVAAFTASDAILQLPLASG